MAGTGESVQESPGRSDTPQLESLSAQVCREAGALTLAVGRVEGECSALRQLSKHQVKHRDKA